MFELNLSANKCTLNSSQLKMFEVVYNLIKRMMNVPIWSSSHEVDEKGG